MSIKIINSDDLKNKVAIVMGTRPGIIKMAPLVKELTKRKTENFIIHTGQHYSKNMDLAFFESLGLPTPKYRVDQTKNYKTHGEQTAEMLRGVEKILLETKPKIVLVCGDANTNLAAGLAARKLGIIVGHVESGLRSHDWCMPEEHNRIILDHISELLFAPTEETVQNLIMDNVRGQIYLTGNTIVDSTFQHLDLAQNYEYTLKTFGVKKKKYILLTCHREENVDKKSRFFNILKGVKNVAQIADYPIIFPMHPRARKRLHEFSLFDIVSSWKQIRFFDPMGYLDSLIMINNAGIVITDSGGIQEESCILHTPCVTIRENTERPETIKVGSNCLAGTNPDEIANCVQRMINCDRRWTIPFGDGCASKRIVDRVISVLENGVEIKDISASSRQQDEIIIN